MSEITTAFLLTTLAGLATGIGSAIAFFASRTNYRFLSVATGFSGGVMLYVSFVEIFPKGNAAWVQAYGPSVGAWLHTLSFFGGVLWIALIDNLVPSFENPHVTHGEEETAPLHNPSAPLPVFPSPSSLDGAISLPPSCHPPAESRRLLRMGFMSAIAIGIHNFPEGIATFFAALEDPKVGVAIAIAVALHNIPEGISISVPIFYATENRRRAFLLSFLSGFAEPVGAVVAYVVLRSVMDEGAEAIPAPLMGMLFGGVAGIMVYISLDELLPTSRAYGKEHDSLLGLIGGMAVMAVSLLFFR